jgi:hypothetical protein
MSPFRVVRNQRVSYGSNGCAEVLQNRKLTDPGMVSHTKRACDAGITKTGNIEFY